MMTCMQWLRSLHDVCQFQKQSGIGVASGSELKRWLEGKSVHINGKAVAPGDPIPVPIRSVVLFPKSKPNPEKGRRYSQRITLL